MSALAAQPVQFGLLALPGTPREVIAWSQAAEAAGFDLMGLGDSQSVYREVTVGSALVAAHTERIRFGPTVINPLTRHPAVAAAAAGTLAEWAPGRTLLGIGSGDSAVHNLGLEPARLAGLREYVTAVRELFASGRAVYQGAECRLNWAPPRVPVLVAASGPKTLELAGETADGVIVLTGLLPDVIEDSLRHLATGAARSGRGLADLDVWWFHWGAVAESRERAIDLLKMSLASGAKHLARFTTEGKHIPEPLLPKFAEVMRRYRFDEHQKPGGANVRLIEELGLVDYLADRLAIVGTPEDCRRQTARAREAGAHQFCVHVAFEDKLGFIGRWAESVMAPLR